MQMQSLQEDPFPHPSPQPTHGCTSLPTRPTILGSTHIPRSHLAALPPSFPCPLSSEAGPAKPPAATHTHPPTWAGSGDPGSSSTQCSSASSGTNALGLFLHHPSSPAGRRNPGWHRKVSLSHLRAAAWPAPGSSEVQQRRGPPARGTGLRGQRSALCCWAAEPPSRARWAQSEQAAGMACSRRQRCCCPPGPPPKPSPLRRLEAQVGTARGQRELALPLGAS